jgi:hypothetical protein
MSYNPVNPDPQYVTETSDYIRRCQSLSPETILQKMGELREFFNKYMTPEGRKFFEFYKSGGLERALAEEKRFIEKRRAA